MNKYATVLLATGIFAPVTIFAQNEIDALRYGQVNAAATARSLSLGGAGGSYGADFSSLGINPAGIGVYRSSEIMVTPVLRLNNMNGTYMGATNTDDNARLNFSNFGLVFSNPAKGSNYDKKDWKSFSVGLGFNRLADFNSVGYYAGNNPESSISEIFAADGVYNGVSQQLVPPFGFLAYNGYLTDEYLYALPYENIIKNGGSLNQSKSWESKGGINEWTISVGGNYKEKLMLGAAVGITHYKYDRSVNYFEEDATGNTDNDFDYLSYNEYLSVTGVGINLKLGAIYVVNDYLRLGAAVHTPTWISLNEVSDYDITTHTERYKANIGEPDVNPVTFVQPDNPYAFDYSLRTPWKGVLSATAFMGKNGFVTADYEYAAYNSMRYNYNRDFNDLERATNDAIKDAFRGTHNLRLGIEGRMDNFMGRLGASYTTSPFRSSDLFNGQQMSFSAGVGARFGGFFLDLAYVHYIHKISEFGYPMLVPDSDALGIRKIPVGIADLRYNNNLIALTIGVKF